MQLESEIKVLSESLIDMWHEWEIRGLVIVSMLAQQILVLYGSRRRCKQYWFRGKSLIREPLLWCAYLVTDWVAGFALGVISNKIGKVICTCDNDNKCSCDEVSNPSLMAFWATLFLVQLGGPDNITVYSLEDNELWPRHMVGLVATTSVTAYMVFLSWDKQSSFSRPSIVMLVVGFISYGERIWAQYSASIRHRSTSVARQQDDENVLAGSEQQQCDPKAMLKRFRFLFISFFTDVVLSTRHIEQDRLRFQGIDIQKAFDVVRTELGLAYDIFYTKALVRYTKLGLISPFIIVAGSSTVYFHLGDFSSEQSQGILEVDIILTYLLSFVILQSAIKTTLYLAFSSFTSHRLGARISGLRGWFVRNEHHFRCIKRETEQEQVVIQYDFLALCKKNNKRPTRPCDLDMSCNFRSAKHCSDLSGMMEVMFNNVKRKSVRFISSNKPNFRDLILRYDRSIGWASELEFQRCIVLWHIATEICYYSNNEIDEAHARYSRDSKNLSDYMFYLLLECRHMLPIGSGLVTLQDTCYEAIHFLHPQGVLKSDADAAGQRAYNKLLQFQPHEARVQVDQSLLSRACGLAVALDLLARDDRNQMWMFLAELWVEMLDYAAANCSGNSHAQQLRRGGEFLSQVWLLQAHFGVLEQFRVTEINQQNEALQGRRGLEV